MGLYRDAETGNIYTLNGNPMDVTDQELEDCCCGGDVPMGTYDYDSCSYRRAMPAM